MGGKRRRRRKTSSHFWLQEPLSITNLYPGFFNLRNFPPGGKKIFLSLTITTTTGCLGKKNIFYNDFKLHFFNNNRFSKYKLNFKTKKLFALQQKKMCFGSGVLSKKNEMSHFPPPPPSLLHQISWRVEQKRPFSGLFMCLRGVRERERERGRERRKEREQRSQQHNNKAFFPPRQRMFALSGICHRNLSLSLSGGGRRGRAASNRKIFFFRALIWVNDKSFQKAPSEVIHLMQIYEKKNLYRCMTNWM